MVVETESTANGKIRHGQPRESKPRKQRIEDVCLQILTAIGVCNSEPHCAQGVGRRINDYRVIGGFVFLDFTPTMADIVANA